LYPHCFSRIYNGSVGTLRTLAGRAKIRAGENFGELGPKLSINFKESIWPTHGNFEEKNKILDLSIITMNYLIIIVNVHYNDIVKLIHRIIIIFLIKSSWRNAIRKKMSQ